MSRVLKELLFKDSRNPVWVFDDKTLRILDVSDALCLRYGYTHEEFLQLTLADIVSPEEQEALPTRATRQRSIWSHRTKSGQRLFADVQEFSIDSDTEATTLAVVSDVTERIKMEREQSELLQRYQVLTQAAHDLMWDWDFKTNKITHNDSLVTVYGYDSSHLQEDIMWWANLIHPDDYQASSWSIQEAIRERRRFWSAEYRFRKADGTYVPVLDRGILQTDESDQPVRMIGSIVDLSSRRDAEDERNQLFRLSQDSMLMLDPSGTITLANSAFYQLVGLEMTPGTRLNMRQFLMRNDLRVFDAFVSRALGEGMESHFPTSISTQNGPDKTVQWGLITNEARNRLFLIGRDITEAKVAQEDLERALARSQELAVEAQAANKAQTEFLQNMSHELRTPMNGLLGTAQILASSAISEKQKHLASILIRSGESLLQIVNDILDFSKVESGEINLVSEPLHLPEIVHSVYELFSLPAKQKGLELLTNVKAEANLTVVGDQFRLRQIISNLIGNAIKFTDDGQIHLSLETSSIKNDMVTATFKVRDSGIGVPYDMQKRIFERFIQADSSSTRRHGGTGLGLSITKSLVELMGGTILLESAVGLGSEFTVKIPFLVLEQGSSIAPPPEAQAISSRPGTRVLIAEDVEVNAMILTSWLEDRGFTCVVAANGTEAMEALEKDDFDGLFLDLHMPDYSGYEVIEMLRDLESATGNHLPVVAVTASVSNEEREKCVSFGFDEYIPKPVLVGDLDRVIKKLFAIKP